MGEARFLSTASLAGSVVRNHQRRYRRHYRDDGPALGKLQHIFLEAIAGPAPPADAERTLGRREQSPRLAAEDAVHTTENTRAIFPAARSATSRANGCVTRRTAPTKATRIARHTSKKNAFSSKEFMTCTRATRSSFCYYTKVLVIRQGNLGVSTSSRCGLTGSSQYPARENSNAIVHITMEMSAVQRANNK